MESLVSEKIVELLQDMAFNLEDLKEPRARAIVLAAVAGQSKESIDFKRAYRARSEIDGQDFFEEVELAIVKALVKSGQFNQAYKRLENIPDSCDRFLCFKVKGLAAIFRATNDAIYLRKAHMTAERMVGVFGQIHRARAWLSIYQASSSFEDLKRAYGEAKNVAYSLDRIKVFLEIISVLS